MAQLSKVNVWREKNERMEMMYNARYHMKNILCYIDFSNLCQVIKYFPQLNPNCGKEDTTLPLSSSSRATERQKSLNEFELGLSIIDTTFYHDFTIDKKKMWKLYFIIG